MLGDLFALLSVKYLRPQAWIYVMFVIKRQHGNQTSTMLVVVQQL